jgi:hypothetical protein
MGSNEHGYCPACGADLDGGSIWEHFYAKTGSEAEADKTAKSYGATRTSGNWGRALGIYNMDLDRTVGWECPDCTHYWGRNENRK